LSTIHFKNWLILGQRSLGCSARFQYWRELQRISHVFVSIAATFLLTIHRVKLVHRMIADCASKDR
jgi:L-asparaginase II